MYNIGDKVKVVNNQYKAISSETEKEMRQYFSIGEITHLRRL